MKFSTFADYLQKLEDTTKRLEMISILADMVQELNKNEIYKIRIDIDDREESVSKKIRDAEKEWIPIIVVIGEKEKKSKKFTPRFRDISLGYISKKYSMKELSDLVIKNIKGYPQEPIPLPMYLSKRPKFRR